MTTKATAKQFDLKPTKNQVQAKVVTALVQAVTTAAVMTRMAKKPKKLNKKTDPVSRFQSLQNEWSK